MSIEKALGKISNIRFGLGGYNDATLGLHIGFEFGAGGCGHSMSFWDYELIECTDSCQWTEEDRTAQVVTVMVALSSLLKKAKVRSVDDLKGIPVEVTLDGNSFKDFRILEEVL